MVQLFFRLRWLWATLLLVGVGVAALGIPHAVVPDNSISVWFMPDDPALESYRRFHRHFGNDEVLLIQISEPEGVLSQAAVGRLSKLTRALEELEGVARVHSLLTSKDAQPSATGVRFGPAVPDPVPEDPAELKQLEARLTQSSLFRDRLISADAKQARVWVEMAVLPDFDSKRDAIVHAVRKTAEQTLESGRYALAGFGVIYAGINALTQRDFAVFLGGCFSLMLLAMALVFRSLRFVLATIGVVVASSAAAMGLLGWAGHRLNMVTSVLPTLLIVLNIGASVHFQTAFVAARRRHSDKSLADVARLALSQVAVPCTLTTLTTMLGFFALASSDMAVISQLGVYAGFGMGVGLLANVVLMTLVFFSFKGESTLPSLRGVTRLLDVVRLSLVKRPGLWGLGLLLVTLLSAAGAYQVEADTYSLGYLPKDSQVVLDHEKIVADWGQYSPLDYTVTLKEGVYTDSPELIVALDKFVQEAQKLAQVHTGFSLHNFYRASGQALGSELAIDQPLSRPMAAQLGLLVESQIKDVEWDADQPAFEDNFVAPFRSEDGRLARITLLVDMQSAQGFALLLEQLEPIARTTLGEFAVLETSGYLPLYISVIDYVIRSQVHSFFLAICLIFGVMLLWLRSLRLALMSLVPNVFPILVMMGVMGALGIDLDVATATVAAIVLGVAIDDTVHFLHHFREAERRRLSWEDSLKYVFERAGRPALITTGLLLLGYPVLMLASVKPVLYFGLLTSVAALAALLADLLLLPLLLRAFSARAPSELENFEPPRTQLSRA